VRGVDVTGDRLDIDTVLDNVSGGGIYLRIPTRVEPGAWLAIGIRFYEPETQEPGARVAARGMVTRVERTRDGQYGVAVEFVRYQVF
jgi:hypothetical protein